MNITAPANHIVVCSGELVNPAVYLYRAEQTRLAQAKLSDKTVLIRTAEEVKGWRLQLQQLQKLGIINLKMLEIYRGHHHQLLF
jgi:hypothetical protein